MRSRIFKSYTPDKLTIWDGAWTNGYPTPNVNVQIKTAYDTATYGSFNCRNLDIRGNLTISAGKRVVVHGTSVLQLSTSTFTIDGGEFALLRKSVDVSQVKMTFKAIVPGIQRLDYCFITSPISGKAVNTISPTTDAARFYEYSYSAAVPAGSLWPLSASSVNLIAGKGYHVRVPSTINPDYNDTYIRPAMLNSAYAANAVSNWVINVNNLTGGTLNAGVIQHTPVAQYAGTYTADYYLVGNPYTATINLRRFFEVNKAYIKPLAFIWGKTNGASGDTYFNTNFNENTYYVYAHNTLPPCMAIMVEFINGSNPANKIVFTPDMMLPANNYSHSFIRLKYKQDTVNRPLSALVYNADGFPQVGQYDNTGDGAMRFIVSTGVYTSLLKTTGVVSAYYPLRVKTFSTGTYTISLESFGGDFANHAITLRDDLLDIVTDLKTASYTFTGAVGMVTDTRFIIKIL